MIDSITNNFSNLSFNPDSSFTTTNGNDTNMNNSDNIINSTIRTRKRLSKHSADYNNTLDNIENDNIISPSNNINDDIINRPYRRKLADKSEYKHNHNVSDPYIIHQQLQQILHESFNNNDGTYNENDSKNDDDSSLKLREQRKLISMLASHNNNSKGINNSYYSPAAPKIKVRSISSSINNSNTNSVQPSPIHIQNNIICMNSSNSGNNNSNSCIFNSTSQLNTNNIILTRPLSLSYTTPTKLSSIKINNAQDNIMLGNVANTNQSNHMQFEF